MAKDYVVVFSTATATTLTGDGEDGNSADEYFSRLGAIRFNNKQTARYVAAWMRDQNSVVANVWHDPPWQGEPEVIEEYPNDEERAEIAKQHKLKEAS